MVVDGGGWFQSEKGKGVCLPIGLLFSFLAKLVSCKLKLSLFNLPLSAHPSVNFSKKKLYS